MIEVDPRLLVEVREGRAVNGDQVVLPAELVTVFCGNNSSAQANLVMTATTPSAACTWQLWTEGQGTRVRISTHGDGWREFVTSTSLVPMALAAWLDLADRGPAPPVARVIDVSWLANWPLIGDHVDGLLVTISRPGAAITVIARSRPTGYLIGSAFEDQRQIVLTPASGCDVWLRVSDLALTG